MRIVETDPDRLHFEGRTTSQRAWLIWGILFLPGLLALLLLPEASRYAGLLVWMAIWLGSLFFLPRLLGGLVRVTVDSKAREIVWARKGQITRRLLFADVKQFDTARLSIASRPYKTFQLIAVLNDGSRITLAVDPNESNIQRALTLARERLRKSK